MSAWQYAAGALVALGVSTLAGLVWGCGVSSREAGDLEVHGASGQPAVWDSPASHTGAARTITPTQIDNNINDKAEQP